MHLSIIIVSFNTRDLTLECLRSLTSHAPRNAEIIVVDNASTDGSPSEISTRFPHVRLLASTENLGFARANNLAVTRAVGSYLLLLNPDTLVTAGAIDALLEFADAHPHAGIWGGRTLYPDGSLNPSSCWARPTPWSAVSQATGLSSLFRRSTLFNPESYGGWRRDSVRHVDIVSGCYFLITRTLWEELGGFDAAFFMYGEEADLCLRARKLGARPMVTPDSTIIHIGGASEQVRTDKMVRLLAAKALLLRRHWRPRMIPFGLAMLAAWPLSRAVAWKAFSLASGSKAATRAAEWWNVWRRRHDWLSTA